MNNIMVLFEVKGEVKGEVKWSEVKSKVKACHVQVDIFQRKSSISRRLELRSFVG